MTISNLQLDLGLMKGMEFQVVYLQYMNRRFTFVTINYLVYFVILVLMVVQHSKLVDKYSDSRLEMVVCTEQLQPLLMVQYMLLLE